MSEPREPTIIEYARFYGLIKDHRTVNPLTLLPEPDCGPTSLEELSETANIELLQASLANEKLTISKEAAKLLSSCATAPDIAAWNAEELLSARHNACKQKLEVPILLTDHELDVQQFGRRIQPDLAGFNLPYERIDEEHDEGFTWPQKHYIRCEELESSCIDEKIEATREVFIYLQNALTDSYTDEDERAVLESELRYERNRILEPVTPPLLPASPEILPFVPSSPTCNLELLSDHTSPTAAQAAEVEDLLMKEDTIKLNRDSSSNDSHSSHTIPFEEANIGQIYTPLKDIREPPSSPWPKHVRLDDRKVEGPLTPPMTIHNPMTKGKNVSFKEVLQEMIPDFPPLIEDPSETSLQDIDAFFDEVIAPIANQVNREVEQEQLQEADSTRRVTVPIMDFSLPVPPWKVYSRGTGTGVSDGGSELDAQKRLMVAVKEKHLKDHRWSGAASLELKLRWSPFPKELGQIATQESIDDDGSVEEFLAELNITDTIDFSALIWKREGLRVLDDAEDSEEELQPGIFSEGRTIEALIKKRRLEIEENLEMSATANLRADIAGLGMKPTKRAYTMSNDIPPSHPQTNLPGPTEATNGQPLLGGAFSAFGALSNFMDVRGESTKKQKLTNSPFFPSPSSKNLSIKAPPANPTPPTQPRSTHASTTETQPSITIPPLTPLPPSRTFITSSTSIHSQRRILRRIQHLHPNATFIERDFRPPNTTLPSKPHVALPQSPTNEADLIVSSSTGILWTTLQAIKQLPLPGQGPKSRLLPIRERIARVSDRYERLFVLVSEGKDTGISTSPHQAAVVTDPLPAPTTLSALSAKDCDALTALTAFCTALDTDIPVLYVAGGEEELARWIAGLMSRYSVGVGGGIDSDSKAPTLLQDETSWEIFLRRAGLNAFAAQEVLMALKPPVGDGDDVDVGAIGGGGMRGRGGEFGLVAFVRMGVEERVRRFEGLLGGRRVLGRVSGRLDVVWD